MLPCPTRKARVPTYAGTHAELLYTHRLLQVPTTQLAKMSIDLKSVELTAGVLEIFFIKYIDYTVDTTFLRALINMATPLWDTTGFSAKMMQ